MRRDTKSLVPDAWLEELAALDALRVQEGARTLSLYYDDPVAFVHDCIRWPEGTGPADYQEEILAALPLHKKVSVRSLHGTGKTAIESLVVLWHSLTRDAAGVDWKCPTTAGAWNQLNRYLWPEIHKWASRLDWTKLHRDPFRPAELLGQNLKLKHGAAFAVASAIPAYIEGVHADSVCYIFDEAKAIPVATWDAAEGAFTGAAGTTIEVTEAFALCCSTPGEPIGRFYDIQSHKAGLEDWHTIHIDTERALRSGRVSPEWVEQRGKQWGTQSAIYANRVLGEFHSADEDAVIPLSWAELAVERWKDNEGLVRGPVERIGVDVARFGEDKTVQALIVGDRVQEMRYSFHEPTDATAGRVAGVIDANEGAHPVVDTDGLGAGVTDILRGAGYEVTAFHGGKATERKDRSGELGFRNWRSAAWWHLREMLDPAHSPTLELPDDPILLGDLTSIKMKGVNAKSQIEIESKDDTKKRLGRSPDAGDAVVYGFWPGERPRRRRRMVAAGRLGPAL